MKQNTKILLLSGCLVLFALTMLTSQLVFAQDTFRIGKMGGSEMIDRHGVCRKVINNHPDYDIFVPVKTAAEWLAFRTNRPAYVDLTECYECIQGSDCTAGYYCRESDHTCQPVPVCQLRVEAGYGTTNVTNNTQVAGCNGTCQACQSGSCGVANAGTDPGNQCASAWTSCNSACVKKGNSGNCQGGVAACATGDVTAYISTSGKVCSGGSEVNPSSSVKCDATINCSTGACSAARYYRGCVAGGTSCTDTNRLSYTAWNAGADTAINQTTYKVETTCTTASTQHCAVCKRCNGAGSCTNNAPDTACGAGLYGCTGSTYFCSSGTCKNGAVGQTCSVSGDCCSTYCYADEDGDGYHAASGQKYCQSSASLGLDCCDTDARAYPGQTTYFTSPNACGSWDYDCDGVINKNQCTTYTKCYSTTPGGSCYNADKVCKPYTTGTPIKNCGQTHWIPKCCGHCYGSAPSCVEQAMYYCSYYIAITQCKNGLYLCETMTYGATVTCECK